MSVPTVTFTPTGFVAPPETEILPAVLADINSSFGGDLNDEQMETPQGQLATSETAVIGEVNNSFVFLTNMFDPAYAFGRYQDALARIYFIQRNPATSTAVQCLCTGLVDVEIPVGSLARADDGNIYVCTQFGKIPASGNIALQFECQLPGPIACPAGTLQIYRAIPGWDTITNPDAGVPGRNVESRADFETRRALTVANNSLGSLNSVLGSVLLVDGVLDAFVTENATNNAATIGGVSLAPNSLYVAVVGGDALAVATAIWKKKAPGCAYNGNTTQTVYDTNPNYVEPFPAYSVSFEIPDPLSIVFAVSIANNAQVPADAATQIQNAIIGAFAGADNGARAKIGSEVYASRYYSTIALLGSWVQIVSIKVGSINATAAVFVGSIAGTALTVSSVTSGTIAIGQTLFDASGNLVEGTKILSGSGTSWVVSHTQTVGSETMQAVVPSLDRVPVNIDQVPVASAADITVTLV